MTREIPLTQGKVAFVDDEDYERVASFKWYAARSCQRNENWYASRQACGRTVYMHRFILDAKTGEEIDHADHNGLNNTKANIRKCSRVLNCANIAHRIPASGYRGVYWRADVERWVAQVSIKGKTIYCGLHYTREDAARERDKIAHQVYGEFAILNFPGDRVPA